MRQLLVVLALVLTSAAGCQSQPPVLCVDGTGGPQTTRQCPDDLDSEHAYIWGCNSPTCRVPGNSPNCDGSSPVALCPDGSEGECVVVRSDSFCD